jgi:2,5-dihydroxypyridine 5,6-dioxygenase
MPCCVHISRRRRDHGSSWRLRCTVEFAPPWRHSVVTTEWRYIEAFAAHFARCGLVAGEVVAVLSESQSRASLVETARLAAQSLGGSVLDVMVPTPVSTQPVPVRSTGASQALAGNVAVVAALAAADLVLDCTVEGLLHAPELGQVLSGRARVLMISNEHPDVFDRLRWDDDMPRRVDLGLEWLRAADTMRVTSSSGTNLTVSLAGSFRAGSTGLTAGPGSIAHWPGGLVLAFPAAHSVNGTLVLAPGDLNLTFNRPMETPVHLTIEDDYIIAIDGPGLDAELFSSYLAAFGDRETYATSHVGWGMNPAARWDTAMLYDRRELWGTEARAVAGNFLYSTGANEHAGRFAAGHFDLPMRNCSVSLDDRAVVVDGILVPELAP